MKLLLYLGSLALLISLTSCANQNPVETQPPVQETLTVDFKTGDHGVMTSKSYSGPLAIQVEGVGQASSTEMSDAFYIYTDTKGNPIQPWHPTEFYNWTLWINGEPADALLPLIPSYNSSHIYVFVINPPNGQLTFAIGDTGRDDNSGYYTISILK